ncbi:unnamed protein product [Heterobilharzia americana]|nr:unnamed protein product [Heterobilharzia americana]CAH8583122.1 unnamed protein product [Heterobilharzia americana]
MNPSDNPDLGDSWIEVTPHSLGYNPNANNHTDSHVFGEKSQTFSSLELSGLHTIVEEQLLTRFLTEAQEHSDRTSDVSASSPPLSHDGLNASDTAEQPSLPYQNTNTIKISTSSYPADFPVTSSGEWASRPEIGAYSALVCQTSGSKASSSGSLNRVSSNKGPWYLRNSTFMKARFIGWLLDHIPNILTHATTFLLGAITMLLFIRKRAKFSKVFNIPLD